MFWESVVMAVQALISNKLRSLLTMLGIIIGVAAVIALVSIGMGVRAQIESSISSLGSNLLLVYPGAPKTPGVRPSPGTLQTLKEKDFEALKKLDEVQAASPVVSRSFLAVAKNKNWTTTTYGVNPDYAFIRDLKVEQGQFITDRHVQSRARVVVLGKTVAKELFGDTNPVGEDMRINNDPFKIIGVLESKGTGGMGQDQDDILIVPYTTAQERMLAIDYLNSIVLTAKDGDNMNRVQEDISNLLRVRHKIKAEANDDFTIQNMAAVLETVSETTQTLTLFLGSVAAISLLVGGIGIMNIMLVSVTERTREIGIRKALGATYRTIITQFLIESIVISVIGGIMGIMLGIGASYAISQWSELKTVLSITPMIGSFAFSVAIGLIFGLYPARKAAKLNPIDALHYE